MRCDPFLLIHVTTSRRAMQGLRTDPARSGTVPSTSTRLFTRSLIHRCSRRNDPRTNAHHDAPGPTHYECYRPHVRGRPPKYVVAGQTGSLGCRQTSADGGVLQLTLQLANSWRSASSRPRWSTHSARALVGSAGLFRPPLKVADGAIVCASHHAPAATSSRSRPAEAAQSVLLEGARLARARRAAVRPAAHGKGPQQRYALARGQSVELLRRHWLISGDPEQREIIELSHPVMSRSSDTKVEPPLDVVVMDIPYAGVLDAGETRPRPDGYILAAPLHWTPSTPPPTGHNQARTRQREGPPRPLPDAPERPDAPRRGG
jgi:hypothetical protein